MDMQIIVLGMHRSGTSILSKTLFKLGVEMGNLNNKKVVHNIEGHYEDQKMLALNEELLLYLKAEWSCLPSENTINDNKEYIINKYLAYINSKKGTWGVKEPRLSIFIHIFHHLLSNPKYIFITRNELSVAKSLEARDNIPIEKGKKLKLQYDQRIKSFLLDKNYLSINYEELQLNPKEELIKLANFLGLEARDEAISHILPREKIMKKKKKLFRSNFLQASKMITLNPHYLLRKKSWGAIKKYLRNFINIYINN